MARIGPMLEKVQREINWKELQKKFEDAQRKMQERQEKLSHELSGACAEL
jgi:hypothetical protein